jgi:hypothetical protein
VGYLRPVKQWNKGKREEFRTRKTFVVEPVQPLEIEVKKAVASGALDSSTKIGKTISVKKNNRANAGEYKQLDLISFADAVDEKE